jgi:hypothetical protein
MKGAIFYVDRVLAECPAEGHAFVRRWWAVHPTKGVAFYLNPGWRDEEPRPQCNQDRKVTESLIARCYPECEARFLPVVFMGHAINEMDRMKKEKYEQRTSTSPI